MSGSSVRWKVRLTQLLLTVLPLGLGGCPQPPPPAPTVAWVQPSRSGVQTTRGGQTQEVPLARRVEADSEVRTPKESRASLFLDAGAWVRCV